jgi:hypothetical protein
MPRGTRIDCVAHYDNSESNPANPAIPPVDVTWGEQTWEEMMIGFIDYVVDAPVVQQKPGSGASSSSRAVEIGKLLLRRAGRQARNNQASPAPAAAKP